MSALPSPELLAKTRRGILFSAPLVIALLRGQKSVTRRLDRSWLKLKPGDLLYVQETIVREPKPVPTLHARYAADRVSVQRLPAWRWERGVLPSIHLPRELSRIALRVTEPPRVEPVQDITEDDAQAEGVEPIHDHGDEFNEECHRRGFIAVWTSLHTKPGERWTDNPDVVRIAFERAS